MALKVTPTLMENPAIRKRKVTRILTLIPVFYLTEREKKKKTNLEKNCDK